MTSNDNFTSVQDTVYDSKLITGLVNAGLFPPGFQVIQAVAVSSALTVYTPLIDVLTNDPVVLLPGQQIFIASGVTVSGAAGAQVGLGATTTSLSTGLLTNIAPTQQSENPTVVEYPDIYLVCSPAGGGTVQVVLIIV